MIATATGIETGTEIETVTEIETATETATVIAIMSLDVAVMSAIADGMVLGGNIIEQKYKADTIKDASSN